MDTVKRTETCRLKKATWPSYAIWLMIESHTHRGRLIIPKGKYAKQRPAMLCETVFCIINVDWKARMLSRSWRWCCRTAGGRNLSTRRTLWKREGSTSISNLPGRQFRTSTGGEVIYINWKLGAFASNWAKYANTGGTNWNKASAVGVIMSPSSGELNWYRANVPYLFYSKTENMLQEQPKS